MIDVAEVRAARRVEPRIGVAIAGAGVVIAVGGAIGLAGDQTGSVGDPNRVPGIVVSLALVAAGVALVRRFRTGALALTGSVAAAAGVPALVVFSTLDDEFPGFDLAATLLVSALGWAALHVVCDRRLLFLAASLVALPLYVMEATEEISNVPELIGYGFASAFTGYDDSYVYEYADTDDDGYDDFSGLSEADHAEYMEGIGQLDDEARSERPDAPDPTVLGAIALLFATLYLVTGRALSDRGSLGAGTPATVVGSLLAPAGIALLGDDLEQVGAGLALVGLGGALLWIGVGAGRRFTTWWGALLAAGGVVQLIDVALGDEPDATGASLVALVVGTAIVLLGHVVGEQLGEAPEEGRSVEDGNGDGEPGPPPVHEIVLDEE